MKEITLGGRKIKYILERKQIKNINIRIKADMIVRISANRSVGIEEIESLLRSKSDNIIRVIDRISDAENHCPKALAYQENDIIYYLGKPITLSVRKGKSTKVKLCTDDSGIILETSDTDNFDVRKSAVRQWQENECRRIVTEMCTKIYPQFKVYCKHYPSLKFKWMVSRWGSCNPTLCTLNFNISLISLPVECIEYIVMHEFTHFIHPNHSPAFHAQMTKLMPDWKRRKAITDKLTPMIIVRD